MWSSLVLNFNCVGIREKRNQNAIKHAQLEQNKKVICYLQGLEGTENHPLSATSISEENVLRAADLVMPFFVIEGENKQEEIESMPGVSQLSLDLVLKEAENNTSKDISLLSSL